MFRSKMRTSRKRLQAPERWDKLLPKSSIEFRSRNHTEGTGGIAGSKDNLDDGDSRDDGDDELDSKVFEPYCRRSEPLERTDFEPFLCSTRLNQALGQRLFEVSF
jgi:hypothetical protein